MVFGFPGGLYLKIRATSAGLVLSKLDLKNLCGTVKLSISELKRTKQWDMVIFEFHFLRWVSGQ